MANTGHSEDVARQTEEAQARLNTALAQFTPGSAEYNELLARGTELVRQTGAPGDQAAEIMAMVGPLLEKYNARIASGGAATPLEERTNKAFTGFREASKPVDWEQDIYRLLEGEDPTTALGSQIKTGMAPSAIDQELLDALTGGEVSTPIGRTFAGQLERSSSPTIDDSVFTNALKLVEDRVNTEAAGRGTLGSGLRLETMGRAGTEAAIAEALRQDKLRQEAYANSVGLYDTGRQVNSGVRDYAANLFNVGQGLRSRDIGVEGALVDMQLGRETNLTGILNDNQNLRLNDMNRLLERNTSQATDDRLDAEADEAARKAAIGQAIGTGLAVAAAPFTGGASLMLAPAAGSLGSNLAGGGGGGTRTSAVPQTSADYLSAQRSGATTGGQRSAPPLSRMPGGAGLDIDSLIRALQQSGGTNKPVFT